MTFMQKRLAELRGDLGVLASALREAADAIDAEGRLPGEELVAQIGSVEQAFAEMLRSVSACDGELFTLGELEDAVRRYLSESQALRVVKRCREIASAVEDPQFFELLAPVFEHAARVEEGLRADRRVVVGIEELEAVVGLVEGRGKLPIAQEFLLKKAVAEHFGEMAAYALATRGVFRVEQVESSEDGCGEFSVVEEAVVGEAAVGEAAVGEAVVEEAAVGEAIVGEAVVEDVGITQVDAPITKKSAKVKDRTIRQLLGLEPRKKRVSMEEARRRRVEKEEREAECRAFWAENKKTKGGKSGEAVEDEQPWSADLKSLGMPSFFVKSESETTIEKGVQSSVENPSNGLKEAVDLESPAVDSPKAMRARAATVEVLRSSEMDEISEALDAAEESEPGYKVWQLLDRGEDALAYHLARGLEGTGKLVSWHVIRAAILGSRVTRSYGQTIALVHEDAAHYDSSRYFSKWDHALNDGLRLLLAAGMLIPTVIGGEASASNVLRDLKFNDSLGCLYDFCQDLIALRGRLPQRIDAENIHVTRDSALWQVQREDLAEKIRAFQIQAPLRTTRYHRATDVWKRWLEDDQLIGSLMNQLLARGDVEELEIESIERRLTELADRNTLEKLVNAADRHFHTTKIEGKTVDQLLKFSEEPVELGRQWVRLHRSNPLVGQSDYVQQHILELRQLLRDRLGEVRGAVSRLSKERSSDVNLYSGVGARFLGQALDRLAELFDPKSVISDASEADPLMLLNTPLLRIASLKLDDDYDPQASWGEISALISAEMDVGISSYLDAFHTQLERADHLASAQLLRVLGAQKLVDASELELLEQTREKRLRFERRALCDALEQTRLRLERSVAYGLVIERDRSRYSALLGAIGQRLEPEELVGNDLRLFEFHETLQVIDRELDASLKGQVETVMQRLRKLDVSLDDGVRSRVEKILAQGNPVTANDYIDMLERGEQLPDESVRNAFDLFFEKEQFHALEKGLQTMGVQLSTALRDGRRCPGHEMEGISEAQRASASALMSAWFRAKSQAGKDVSDAVEIILSELGFSVEKMSDPVHRQQQVSEYLVRVQPLRDRNLCPLASYGSNINGSYSIMCVWKAPDAGELMSIVGENRYLSGVIVFYFGRMNRHQRRLLAVKSQKERRTFLVLDDTLTYWLCGVRSARLPVFFQCAFPFTYTAPFDAPAGQVPPEMFYGRKSERERIEDPQGTCFIYGGRQLGKTALLRHVVRERHAPGEGRVFLWIDLKAKGLGYSQSIDRIGHVIASELKPERVLPRGMVSSMLEETIYDHIAGWLEEQGRRRILLLLDEADRFLELDAHQDFLHCTRLKNLMERTNRRFKVVFAGLHNVQRTTRRENHPLAHFGEPICIGPLYENGEWKEALELIEKPFETMGFRFESRDLPFRILSQTNFYPSLLQIYGRELLRYLYQHHEQVFDANCSPPYMIQADHLQKAYQSQTLRNTIREKFKYTLQLDQRYEVIVYAIAHEVRHHNPELLIDGLSVTRVRELALHWWEAGFTGIDSGHEIRVLLDEMVGLGVLRQVDAGRYTLRNINIVLLLGTNHEIDEELLRERTLPAEYEPASFRSTLSDDEAFGFRRSPLTRAQESQILEGSHGVVAVFGTDAAGHGDLARRLDQLCGDKLIPIRVDGGLLEFEKALDEAVKNRKGDGVWVFHVASELGWDREWLLAAVKISQRKQSHRTIVRVVFSADSARVWELCAQIGDEEELLSDVGVAQVVTMEPWRVPAVQMWLSDVQERVMSNHIEQLSAVTGKWPEFLYAFHRLVQDENPDTWGAAVEHYKRAVFDEGNIGEQLAKFGVPEEVGPMLNVIVEKNGVFEVGDLLKAGHNIDEVHRLVRWGRWLRLIQLNGGAGRTESGFELDPVLKELLEFSMLRED